MSKDSRQYGNERGLSINHYLIKMINKILISVDKNSNKDKFSVIATMLDYSQAFERQSNYLGIQSFIQNNVRLSLIPTLINFFKNRKLSVKWKKTLSDAKEVSGGGPQGGNAGILEYISLTKGNLDFISEEDAFKFVDDTTFLEILNLLSIGLASLNPKAQVSNDIAPGMLYLPGENSKTQSHLNTISKWTDDHQMKINTEKTKYMIFNYCKSYQYGTRFFINKALLQQVHEIRLLGVIIQDDLTWSANTKYLVKRAYTRMLILRKLSEFKVPKSDMITIYILFIRSVIEQSSVVWSSSLTQEDISSFERVQKIALKIIYKHDYLSYEDALNQSKIQTMKDRYKSLLLRFAIKCTKSDRTKDILPLATHSMTARKHEKYQVPFASKQRYYDSAIPTMARMLNSAM